MQKKNPEVAFYGKIPEETAGFFARRREVSRKILRGKSGCILTEMFEKKKLESVNEFLQQSLKDLGT